MRVPPSASRTSQSTVRLRSPRASRSTIARRLRPIRRWISVVLPSILPERSRPLRGAVLPGWAAKVDVVDAVEGIMLIGQREKESFTPQRFGSFREDGTEALHVPHVDPERGVEVVAIARGG